MWLFWGFFVYQGWKSSDKRRTNTKVQRFCPDVQVLTLPKGFGTSSIYQLFHCATFSNVLSVGCRPDGHVKCENFLWMHEHHGRTVLPEGNKFICHFFYRLCCSRPRKWPLNRLTASLRPSVGRRVWPVRLPLWLHRNVALDRAKVHKQSRVGSSPALENGPKAVCQDKSSSLGCNTEVSCYPCNETLCLCGCAS